MRRQAGVLAALAGIALLAAGCSGSPTVTTALTGFRLGKGGPRPGSPVFQAAQLACQKLMPGGPP